MKKDKIQNKLEKLNGEIAKITQEKDSRIERIKKAYEKTKGREKECEDRIRKLQHELDLTLSRLSDVELEAIKLLEECGVDEGIKLELAENRIHLKNRKKQTEERLQKHRYKIPIPWSDYEEALKDTTEKENLEKRLEELRTKMVFTRG